MKISLSIIAIVASLFLGSRVLAAGSIPVGPGPIQNFLKGSTLYVSGNGTGSNSNGITRGQNNLSIIDTTINKVIKNVGPLYNQNPILKFNSNLYFFNSNTITTFDIGTNTISSTVTVPGGVDLVQGAIPSGSETMYVSDSVSSKVFIFDISGGSPSYVTSIALSGSLRYEQMVGTMLYVTNSQGQLFVIDTTSNTLTNTISIGENAGQMVLVGNYLYIPNIGSNSVSVVNITNNSLVENIGVGGAPISITAMGAQLYVLNQNDGTLSVIDASQVTPSVTSTISVGGAGSLPTSITSSGTKIYLIANGGSLVTVDTGNNTVTTATINGDLAFASVMNVVNGQLYIDSWGTDSVLVVDPSNGVAVPVPPPVLTKVGGYHSNLIMTYDEALDAGSTPDPSDFSVTVNGNADSVTNVSISGNQVTLTLGGTLPFSGSPTVLLSYTPGAHPLQDAGGNQAVALVNQTVTDIYVITYTVSPTGSGTIDGMAQEALYVPSGTNGKEVNAQPNGSYQFVNWSDSITNNVRTDKNVTGDISVTANFEIAIVPPRVVTNAATGITKTGATLNGTITVLGGENANETEFFYMPTTMFQSDIAHGRNPILDLTQVKTSGNYKTGGFSYSVTGLTCNTEYTYAAVASSPNESGDGGEGGVMTFTTASCYDAVTSIPAPSTATLYGCKDPKAENYNLFSASDPSLCQYASSSPISSGVTSPHLSNMHNYHFVRRLKQGMVGDDVIALEKFLGITPAKTKFFGAKTRQALMRYQKFHGLKADGVLGTKTALIIESEM